MALVLCCLAFVAAAMSNNDTCSPWRPAPPWNGINVSDPIVWGPSSTWAVGGSGHLPSRGAAGEWRPSSPMAGICIGQAATPGPSHDDVFDDLDAAIGFADDYREEIERLGKENKHLEGPPDGAEEAQPDTDCGGAIIPRHDIGFTEQQCAEWAAAESSLNCSFKSTKAPANGYKGKGKGKKKGKEMHEALPDTLHLVFHACKKFHGSKSDYHFKSGSLGTGYYKDGAGFEGTNDVQRALEEKAAAFKYELKNASAHLPPAVETRQTRARRARDNKGARPKKKKQQETSEVVFGATSTLGNSWWKKHGWFAIDTSNPNSFDSGRRKILKRSKADAVLLQETKLKNKEELESAKRVAKQMGWSSHLEPARHLESDRGSGGCAVAIRSGGGIVPVSTADLLPDTKHRIAAAWADIVVKGGITMISVYMAELGGAVREEQTGAAGASGASQIPESAMDNGRRLEHAPQCSQRRWLGRHGWRHGGGPSVRDLQQIHL